LDQRLTSDGIASLTVAPFSEPLPSQVRDQLLDTFELHRTSAAKVAEGDFTVIATPSIYANGVFEVTSDVWVGLQMITITPG
jgi:hypothetical protein